MSRREFPAKFMLAAYERAAGSCEGCGLPLQVGRFHYDHILPDALGGEPTLENCRVLCVACHAAKTHAGDVPQIAKMKRQRVRHIGAKAPSSRPLPGGKGSPWRKKVNGQVVPR